MASVATGDWETQKARSPAASTAGQREPPQRRLYLVAGISGLAFVLLWVGPLFAFSLGPSPSTGPRDVAAYYAQHESVLLRIQYLRALATVFMLVFLAGLGDLLRQVDARASAPATGVVAAGATAAALGLVLYAARSSIALNAAQLQDPAVVQTIRDLTNALDAFSSLPVAALVGLTSWTLLATRGAARRIGQAGIVVAALLLVLSSATAGIMSLRPLGAAGFLLSALWLAALSLLLFVHGVAGKPIAGPR